MESEQLQAFDVISDNFGLMKIETITFDDARNLLALKISELINNDMEKLLSILYRIDVSQKKTDEIFKTESKDEIALNLADAVINRQIMKIITRKKYRNHGEQ